jgi:hypothetical protein
MKIKGVEGMTVGQAQFEVQNGAKFVVYHYCISILVITFRRSSDIYFIRKEENAVVKGLGYTFLTLVAGWWGFPWGPIYTVTSLLTNLKGGKDVTKEVMASFTAPAAAQQAAR